jgi:hypothetical protein
MAPPPPPPSDPPAERIVFCVDMDAENSRQSVGKRGRVAAIADGVSMLIETKLRVSRGHTFALVTLGSEAEWVLDFTDARDVITSAVLSLQSDISYPRADLGSLFRVVAEHVAAGGSDSAGAATAPAAAPEPTTPLRVILIYGRSNVVPTIRATDLGTDTAAAAAAAAVAAAATTSSAAASPAAVSAAAVASMMLSPNFFFDAVFVHERPSDVNACQKIFDTITSIEDQVATAVYAFETHSNLAKLMGFFATLVAHPLQRPVDQIDFQPKLAPMKQPPGSAPKQDLNNAQA